MAETQPDLLSQLINSPFLWFVIALIIIYFIIRLFMSKKKRPEEQPFYGVKVREEMTQKQVKRRGNVWGRENKYTLRRGLDSIGKIRHIETIQRLGLTNPKNDNPEYKGHKKKGNLEEWHDTYHTIAFRKWGLMAWIKANLLGKYEHIICDPQTIIIGNKDIVLDPKAFMIDDSGVWVVSRDRELKFIDDLNVKKDVENIKGFTSDFLRRLSTQAPSQAMITEKMTHEADLEEKKRKNRLASYTGK